MPSTILQTSMLLFIHPAVASAATLLSLVVLLVFCLDKSRQNRRTRIALYNCIYPIYGACAFTAAQLADELVNDAYWSGAAWVIISVMGMMIYLRFFRRQHDLPFNALFWAIGLAILVIMLFMGSLMTYTAAALRLGYWQTGLTLSPTIDVLA